MTRPQDRPVALVTGGARRVGRATSLALARAGCDVVITYNRSREEAEKTAAEVRGISLADGSHPEARVVEVDLGDLAAVERVAGGLASTLGRLDVLVHNASVYEHTPLAALSAEQMLSAYRINAVAPVLLSKHLAPLLAKSQLVGGGAIVAMGDIHAMGRPRRELLAYSMSKAALIEMVQTLARELAPAVRVNGVAPGVVAFAESGPDADPAMRAGYVSRVPLGRSGTPEDAAEAVRWLALDTHYVTGQIVRVDGGRWLA